jgi:UDP-3-O-[3-hydroxymyristoyl] glucosamine N-acyltransferase
MANDKPSGAQAHIDPAAFICSSATVHAGAWIGPEVELGEGVIVGPGAVLGFPPADGHEGLLRVGARTWIGPGAHIEPDVEIGADCKIGFGTTIGSQTHVGQGVFMGSRCMLVGNCRIADFAMLYADVHVCKWATLETSCQLMPGVILLNEPYPPTGLCTRGPTIGPCAVVCVNSLIWPGVKLGYHALVAAMSEVKHDVPDFGLVRGCPAEYVCDVREIRAKIEDKWVFPYPWMRHLAEGEDVTKPGT